MKVKFKSISVSILLAVSCAVVLAQAVNPKVTQANIQSTICKVGWTKTVRPPSSYTRIVKLEQLSIMFPHLTPEDVRTLSNLYEEDHILPLGMGGHPTKIENLTPQLWGGKYGAYAKDVVERKMQRDVCSGKVPLAFARDIFVTGDWKLLVK
jgi:hypothetical protein